MALAWLNFWQRIWPFTEADTDIKVSHRLVSELQIPDDTKQFVFAIQEPEIKSVIYILYVHGLSEKSAADTKQLIRVVHPDAVISDWSWAYTSDNDFGDSPSEPIPTSAFRVMKQCFLYRTNKDRYQRVARNCVVQEIFGVGYERHHLVAKNTAEEIGSSYLMGSPHYFKAKPAKSKQQLGYEAPLFAQTLYPIFTGLHSFFTFDLLNLPLACAQRLLQNVDNGGKVDTGDLSQVYRFRLAVEAVRLMKYREGKWSYTHNTVGTELVSFSELSSEEQSQYLAAQGLHEQAKKFKKIVFVTGQDDWTGIRRFLKSPAFQESKEITAKLYVTKEDSGVEFSPPVGNDRTEKRPATLAAVSLAVSAAFCKQTPAYNFIRREKKGLVPWFAFAAAATCLQYADAIISLPAAPGIARLGRGIQSLQKASPKMDPSRDTPKSMTFRSLK